MEKPTWNGPMDHTTMDAFTKKRYLKFLDKQAQYDSMKYEQRKSWAQENPNWKADMEKFATEKPRPNLKAIDYMPSGKSGMSQGGKDLLAMGLAMALKPEVAGEGSDTLPADEQKKKDETNKRAKALLAKRK